MGVSDFYKSDLLRNKKLAGFDGGLEEIDINNPRNKGLYLLPCFLFMVAVYSDLKLSL